jgi:hypothetical protein
MPINIIDESSEDTGGKDLRSAMTVTKESPEEAAVTISRANLLDVPPDTYSDMKDQLQAEAIATERVPSEIQPQTEKYLRDSTTRLSLAGEDIDKMNAFERRANYYKEQTIDLPELNREINEITSKKFNTEDGVLEEGDEVALQGLREKRRSIQESAKAYGIDGGEELAVEVVSGAGDMLRSYWNNKEIIAGSIGAGALIGGATGSVVPAVGTIAGLTAGATKGAIGGFAIASFVDGYEQTSASMYDELDTLEGKNVPHDRKVNISRAVGVVSGFASSAAGLVLAKNNAFLKRFLDPSKASAYLLKTPAMAAKLNILGGIAKSIMSEGSEEGFQELVQIFGKNFGSMDESEASFSNALEKTVTDVESLKQAGHAAVVGGLTGGLVQTVTSAPGYGSVKNKITEMGDVTRKKQEVLQNQNTMLELAQDMKDSKIGKVAPQEMKSWQKMIFETIGIDQNVYAHLQDLREFSNSPEKGAAVRKIINPNGDLETLSQELDTPLPINKADLMEIVTEFPEITDHVRSTPDGQNPLEIRKEAEELPAKMEEAEGKRSALMDSLGLEEATPEQQAQLQADLQATMGDSKYFSTRESYLDQSAIQPVEGVVNAKDAADLSQAQVEARLALL